MSNPCYQLGHTYVQPKDRGWTHICTYNLGVGVGRVIFHMFSATYQNAPKGCLPKNKLLMEGHCPNLILPPPPLEK